MRHNVVMNTQRVYPREAIEYYRNIFVFAYGVLVMDFFLIFKSEFLTDRCTLSICQSANYDYIANCINFLYFSLLKITHEIPITNEYVLLYLNQ